MPDETRRIELSDRETPVARGLGAAWIAACIATDVIREAERTMLRPAGKSGGKTNGPAGED